MNKFETIDVAELSAVVGGKKKKGGVNWGKVGKCALAVGTTSVATAATGNVPLWLLSSASAYLGSCQ